MLFLSIDCDQQVLLPLFEMWAFATVLLFLVAGGVPRLHYFDVCVLGL